MQYKEKEKYLAAFGGKEIKSKKKQDVMCYIPLE